MLSDTLNFSHVLCTYGIISLHCMHCIGGHVQSDDLYKNRSVVFQAQDVVDFDVTYGEPEPDITGETYVSFGNDAVSDQQTETDVKELEGKHKMSLQEMKEQILGSVSSSKTTNIKCITKEIIIRY